MSCVEHRTPEGAVGADKEVSARQWAPIPAQGEHPHRGEGFGGGRKPGRRRRFPLRHSGALGAQGAGLRKAVLKCSSQSGSARASSSMKARISPVAPAMPRLRACATPATARSRPGSGPQIVVELCVPSELPLSITSTSPAGRVWDSTEATQRRTSARRSSVGMTTVSEPTV